MATPVLVLAPHVLVLVLEKSVDVKYVDPKNKKNVKNVFFVKK